MFFINSNTTNVKVKQCNVFFCTFICFIQIQPMLRLNNFPEEIAAQKKAFKYNQC